MTDQELQIELVKMLPEKVKSETHYGYPGSVRFYWNDTTNNGTDILDTEWLYVCWLIEQELPFDKHLEFRSQLWLDTKTGQDVSASWQKRAATLIKVKEMKV